MFNSTQNSRIYVKTTLGKQLKGWWEYKKGEPACTLGANKTDAVLKVQLVKPITISNVYSLWPNYEVFTRDVLTKVHGLFEQDAYCWPVGISKKKKKRLETI